MKSWRWLGLIFLLIVGLFSCDKSKLPALPMPQPNLGAAIVLTLDDSYISNWYDHRDWLDSLGLKVTFFITQHRPLTGEDWLMLDTLINRGHAVESHTVHHLDVKAFLQGHQPSDWIAQEIKPQLADFKAHNIYPTVFAWPYGQVDHKAEALMGERFALFRECLNPNQASFRYQQACYSYDGSRTIQALCLDSPYQDTMVIAKAVQYAAERQQALVLYGHELADVAQPGQTPKAGILYLAKLMRQHNMKSVCMGQLVRAQ